MYLYRKNHTYYNDTRIFSYKSSGFDKEYKHYTHNIFDIDGSGHWTDSGNQFSNTENFFSFCFEKGVA